MEFSIKNFLNDNQQVVEINKEASDWKEAIKVSIKPLIELGVCTDEYYDSIIQSTEKFGPYYILCPNVAMPHGEMGKGVSGNAVSLTVFKNDIEFAPNNTAKILMTLCAKDATVHTSIALPQIAALFENEANIEKILEAKSSKEIIDLINALDLSKYLS